MFTLRSSMYAHIHSSFKKPCACMYACLYVHCIHLSSFPVMTDYIYSYICMCSCIYECVCLWVLAYISISLSSLSNHCQGNLASRLYTSPTTSKSFLRTPNLLSSCTNTIGVDKRVSLIFSNAFSTSGVLHQRGQCVNIPPRKYQWTSVRSMAQVNVVQVLRVYIINYTCMYVPHL